MKRDTVLEYLRSKKEEFRTRYGITTLGIYGSVARDEATEESDVDIFYQTDSTFSMGLFEFTAFLRNLETELHSKIDFVNLKSMNPIIKHYAQKDFIYV
ncbi:MAG: nucleotidyltransferase domain-containing protein [Sulfuricurvum sp.]|jgi:hypothetical protein|uniref:nucleotidyltransferase family protein n=1 Tax=Sulfuricurvum sp. TaxID=2025608 RepID=UPI0025E3070E|nr:nucleotidyltransferase domain-containing protein [Sulfuricurvum sp.]MCK9374304.1 nucleotidyltransferase domain-containing protein [Sulfuricurvum sp.]